MLLGSEGEAIVPLEDWWNGNWQVKTKGIREKPAQGHFACHISTQTTLGLNLGFCTEMLAQEGTPSHFNV
jgi:hypothetical protein